jgi:hypothetical protein
MRVVVSAKKNLFVKLVFQALWDVYFNTRPVAGHGHK